MKKQTQHKAVTEKKQPGVDISTAKDKEEKHEHEDNDAGHDHKHGGMFGKNTELIFAAVPGL